MDSVMREIVCLFRAQSKHDKILVRILYFVLSQVWVIIIIIKNGGRLSDEVPGKA